MCFFVWRKSYLFLLLVIISINPIYANTKICLTGSDVETLPSYGQSFMNGARLARSQSAAASQVEILPYFYNRQPLEAIRIYTQMQKDGCSAIIGFDSLTDVMLVVRSQNLPYIPIFTAYPSTISTDVLPSNIFIAMPTYDFFAKKMIMFMNKKFGILKNVLLVTEVNRNEMQDYKEVYSAELKKLNVTFETFDFLEGDVEKDKKFNKLIKNKKYDYVFMFTTANDAAEFANILNNDKTIYIGTEYFGSSSMASFHIRLKTKETPAYLIRNLDFIKPNKALSEFRKSYMTKFNTEPTILSAYAYDATKIILKTIAEKKQISPNDIVSISYQGITGVSIVHGKFQRSSEYVILSNTKDGYQYAI